MKIYLAARYSRYLEMQRYANELEQAGHVVCSRWITGEHDKKDDDCIAGEDYADLQTADAVISFTEGGYCNGRGRGGRHVEFGMAVAFGKRLVVIGYRENVFHSLPAVEFFETFEQFLDSEIYHQVDV